MDRRRIPARWCHNDCAEASRGAAAIPATHAEAHFRAAATVQAAECRRKCSGDKHEHGEWTHEGLRCRRAAGDIGTARCDLRGQPHTKLFDEVGSLGNEAKRRSDELSGKLNAEAGAREVADKEIREQLKETAIGSFHLDVWGVLFVMLGIVAGTASQEIAGWIGAGSCG